MPSPNFALSVLQHTPVWVWGLLALLIALGLRQRRTHDLSPARATLPPLAMLLLALAGVLGTFGSAAALLAWAAVTVGVAAAWTGRAAPNARWLPAEQRFRLPGSWLPLGLMMGIFITKFAVGVGIALHPALARSTAFALGVSALYGMFSGIFAARALALQRLRGRAMRVQLA